MQSTLGTVRTMSTNLSGPDAGAVDDQCAVCADADHVKHADEASMRPLGRRCRTTRALVDDDMLALYTYIKAIPRRVGTNDKATQENARYCTMDNNCNMAGGETCSMTTKEWPARFAPGRRLRRLPDLYRAGVRCADRRIDLPGITALKRATAGRLTGSPAGAG